MMTELAYYNISFPLYYVRSCRPIGGHYGHTSIHGMDTVFR